jgi:membrane fusion protein (multidrug efflux system)
VQFDAQAISQAQLDADKADLKGKRASAAAQRALVEKKILRAPFAGRVGIRNVNPGQYLNPGDKVVTLQAIDPILVDFNVPQQLIGVVTPGRAVELETDAFAGRKFTGKVTASNPKVDSSTRNVQVEAAVANAGEALLPGMFARVHVASGDQAKYLTVPQTAVTYNPYGTTIYVLDSSKPNSPPIANQAFVTLGPTRGDQVAVMQGLKEGDLVVTSGQLKLRPGGQVSIDNTVMPKNDPHPTPQEQ